MCLPYFKRKNCLLLQYKDKLLSLSLFHSSARRKFKIYHEFKSVIESAGALMQWKKFSGVGRKTEYIFPTVWKFSRKSFLEILGTVWKNFGKKVPNKILGHIFDKFS